MRTIGKYAIGETLGVGGFSKVKLGIDQETQQRVALKLLSRKAANDSASVRQVRAEINAMSKIQHENVIRLLDGPTEAKYPKADGTEADVIMVVLEFAAGGEFFDFLSYTGKYPEAIARDFFKQLIGGLEACHLQGVAHRDVKPENLLLDDQFRLKIADFGFSKCLNHEEESMDTECGTRGYMAPEILEHSRYTMKTDIFAAGVVLFIMLAGFPPFQIARRNDWWFHKLIVGRENLFWQAHTRTAQFSDTAKDLIEKLLAPDANKRASLEDIKSHPWFTEPTELTRDQIFMDLSERKIQVDDRKEREKRDNMAVRVANPDAPKFRGMDAGVPCDLYGIGADAELGDMPTANPSMQAVFGKRQQADGGGAGGSLSSFHSADGAAAAAAGDAASSPTSPPEVYKQDEHTQSYTQFLSNRPATEILREVVKRLNDLNVRAQARVATQDLVVKQQSYKIKATHVDGDSEVKFVAKVYRHADHEGIHQVVFTRRKGDVFAYQKMFAQLHEALADLTCGAPTESPQADDDTDDDGPS